MFLCRKNELANLSAAFNSGKKAAVLVYGKRRIGKSTLIKEASKSFKGVMANFLCVKSSFEGNLSLLCRTVALALGLPSSTQFDTLFDLFDFLKAQKKRILLVLDEYQYLKESKKESEVDSMMQAVIDSMGDNITLVLCGSYIAVMKELLQEGNPLFGRFALVQRIEEFDYYEAAKFYPNLPVREKIRFYSVFGGSPYVLSNLNYSKSLEENIVSLAIGQDALLRSYIENIMLKEIQKAYDVRILELIANGKKRYSEILSQLNMSDTGLLDKQLKNLIAMETIEKVFPINKPDDKKKVFYQIKDNFMRFYFAYIFAMDNLILKFGQKEFFKSCIARSLDTFISYRLEGIANQYFARKAKKGALKGVLDFGSYWYDDPQAGKNGQYDVVLKRADGYDFYEVKFLKTPMKLEQCKAEEAQVRSCVGLDCKNIGFVSSSGFSFKSRAYNLISGADLY